MKYTSSVLFTCLLFLSIASQPIQAIANPTILNNNRLAIAKDEFSLLKNERIGNLRIGLSAAKVKQTIDCQPKREPEQFWGADGAYHQKWKYANCGITLGMVSAQKGATKSIESITIFHPSRLSTKRGIRIGSTETAVMQAYQAEGDLASSKSGTFVAGSVYGGIIFQFQNGKVSRIFLGAAAE
jgi:hypothetical protein